jgi:hypothetical protein
MDCLECERLWSLYGKRIEQQTDLLAQYHEAVEARELGKVQELEGALALADRFRNTSRENLMGHRAVAHTIGSTSAA